MQPRYDFFYRDAPRTVGLRFLKVGSMLDDAARADMVGVVKYAYDFFT
jgi:hypothetical protein